MSDNTHSEADTTGDWIYSDVVRDHFFNPRNLMLDNEEEFQADGSGMVGSPACGDMMKLWIKVDRKTDKITDLRWRTFGCASAIATTSILSEMVRENGGMPIDEAYKITPQAIVKKLGGLPDNKIHCSVLGDKALRAAIKDYFKQSGQKQRITAEPTKILCHCLNVSAQEVEEAVVEGAHDFAAVQAKTKCGTMCGGCVPEITQFIEETKAKFKLDEK